MKGDLHRLIHKWDSMGDQDGPLTDYIGLIEHGDGGETALVI